MTPHIETTRAIDVDCTGCKAKVGVRCEPEHPCEARRASAAKITREANRAARKQT